MQTATLIALVFVLLTSSCTAQLLGCEDVGRLSDRNGGHCELDGTTLTVLGISEVNNSLTSQPVTWTVGISHVSAPSTSLGLWHKDLYLGQPPATQLQTSQSTTGCAFFFEGVSSLLEFHDMGLSPFQGDGTCQDALTSECVSSWKSQPDEEVSKAVKAGSLDCPTLASTLRNNLPSQCKNLDSNWGLVSAQEITHSGRAAPLTLTTCNPTISNDYTVSHVASFKASLPYMADKMFYAFLASVTPVMTILLPRTDAASSAGSRPEVHLNCLKVKEVNHIESTSPGGVESGAARMAIYGHAALAMLIMILAVMCFPRGDNLWS